MFSNSDNSLYFLISCIALIVCIKYGVADNDCNKVIIDTDAGGDDAVAIAEIILASQKKSPPIDILGITCVSGNTKVKNVVVNVLKVLRVLNATDIPVYIGADRPLLSKPAFDYFYGIDGLGDVEYSNPPIVQEAQKKSAVNALIDFTSKYPGEVTIIAIGPLTNIALASRLSPDFRSNIKDLFVLGGILNQNGTARNGAEYNFYFDPEAASMVFNDTGPNIKPVTQLTTDVEYTQNIPLAWRWDGLATVHSPIVKFLNQIEINVWRDPIQEYTPYDAFLAAAFITDNIVVSTKNYCEEVLHCENDNRGKVVVKNDNICYKNAIIIREIDTRVFMQLLTNLYSI